MCTLVVATRVWDTAPLVVAANRDEQLARPASPPHRWARDDEQPVFAPRDLEAKGTWLGVRGASLFVGITNRWDGGTSPTGRRSRGQLVLDALARDSAEAAAEFIAGVPATEHAPFHLVMADRAGAFLVWNDGREHHHERLAPGLHVVSERSRDAAPTGRDDLLRRRLEGLGPTEPSLDVWRTLVSEHADNPLEGPCVHADARGYGTRCSTVVRLPPAGGIDFFHADGRPCVTEYDDLSVAAREV